MLCLRETDERLGQGIRTCPVVVANQLLQDPTQCTRFLKPSPLTKNNNNTLTINLIIIKMERVIICRVF